MNEMLPKRNFREQDVAGMLTEEGAGAREPEERRPAELTRMEALKEC
jgi:hypothetical protein